MPLRSDSQADEELRRIWLDAVRCADEGRDEEAWAAVERALQLSPGDAELQAIGARLLLLVDDFAGATRVLATAEAAQAGGRNADLVLVARAFVRGALGDFAAAKATFEEIITPAAPLSLLFAAVELCVQVDARDLARRYAALAQKHSAVRPPDLMRLAELLHLAGEDDLAVTLLQSAMTSLDNRDAGLQAAQLFLACRACDDAEELFRRQIDQGKHCADAHFGLATIHLWRSETNDARRHAAAALESAGDTPQLRRILAAATLLEGRSADALVMLDSLVLLAPRDAETRVWRAEAMLRCGHLQPALAEARIAGDLSSDHSAFVVLSIVEALAALGLGSRPRANLTMSRAVAFLLGEETGERVRCFLRRKFTGRMLAMDRALAAGVRWARSLRVSLPEVDHPATIKTILEESLVQLGGNRTHATPTRLLRGVLAPLVVAPPLRSEVRAALHAVRIGGYAEAAHRLQALIERYPDWPHPWYYRAELQMWMGRLDDARRDLEAALAKKLRNPEIERGHWPRIGLAGVQLLQGQAREALRTLDQAERAFGGAPAQPYFAWRGEILRALGRLEEARTALEVVCRPGGCRLGSMITLALTLRDLGDRDRGIQVLRDLVQLAPQLMIDVTRSADEEIFRDALQEPDGLSRLSEDETFDLLLRAQRAMRGNRSASCLTFVDAANQLRAIPPNGVYRFVNRRDELDQLRDLLRER